MMNDTEIKKVKKNALEKKLIKNLSFFKAFFPEIYEQFVNYTPKQFSLSFQDDLTVNLVNHTGREVYPECPVQYAEKQVDDFEKTAVANIVRLDSPYKKKTPYIHDDMSKRFSEIRSEFQMPNIELHEEDIVQQLFIIGVGVGVHIEEILKKKQVNNLVIVDDNEDSFYYSMCFVDWEFIFSTVKGQIKIIISDSGEEIVEGLHAYVDEVGSYPLAKMYVLKHYVNKNIISLLNNFFKKLLIPSQSTGFYDDEKVGLSHSILNYQKGVPLSTVGLLQRKIYCELPALVLGNGPSLDQCENFIKENKDSFILISCGSTLSTLEKMGIKPDIHVEQERPLTTYQWLQKTTSESFRKGIYFIGLNTVYPDCFDLFDSDRVGLCLKPNDLGTLYLARSLKQNNTLSLADLSNPTVTNFGLSLCVLLGIKQVYLAGVDLGTYDTGKAHSDKSYYTERSKKKAKTSSPSKSKIEYFKVKGKGGRFVNTTSVLNSSRIHMERLIAKYELDVKNFSDGAEIIGAEFANPEQGLQTFENSDKNAVLNHLYESVFKKDVLSPVDKEKIQDVIRKDISLVFGRVKRAIDMGARDESELLDIFSKIRNEFLQAQVDSYSKMIIVGSLESMLLNFHSVMIYGGKENFPKVYQDCREIVFEFMERTLADIEGSFFELDQYADV